MIIRMRESVWFLLDSFASVLQDMLMFAHHIRGIMGFVKVFRLNFLLSILGTQFPRYETLEA